MPLVYLVAGEASGDMLGGRLIAALRRARPDLEFAGIGGPRMQAAGGPAGFASLFPMRDLAVMGLAEILPRLLPLRRRLAQARADLAARRPDLLLTIDSPGFCLRLLASAARAGLRRAHYVAPQTWAWKESRVRRFPGLWDALLCLLPFEPAYFARHGLPARFVGHPVLESGADAGDGAAFRRRHGLEPDAPLLVLMPGSRASEAPRLLPVFGAALALLHQRMPALRAAVPVSPVVAGPVAEAARGWPSPPILLTDIAGKHDAYAAAAHAGAALTKSGTSTLELALAGTPMAVTYRVNPVTAAIARRMIRVPHVAMANLLAGREVAPELLQERCRPAMLADAVAALLAGGGAAQRAAFAPVLAGLAPPNGMPPSDAAAAAALELLQ